MTYKLHYKLNLPKNPLVENFQFPTLRVGYLIKDPSILSSELIEALAKKDFIVDFAVLFCRIPVPKSQARMNQGLIHSDVTWSNGEWKSIYYGINYEVTDNVSELSWWETSDTPIMPDEPETVTIDDTLRGVHYGYRNNMDPINDNYKRLDSTLILGPTLVNTHVPHSINYYGVSKPRWGLSIRLKNEYGNWENSVDAFKELIQE
jgi:hypothetical protein